jgi:plastocyanin
MVGNKDRFSIINKILFMTALVLVLLSIQGQLGAEEKTSSQPFVAAIQDGVQKVEVVGGSYFFRPSHIVVKVDVPVELSISKESGITPHDIAMKSPEAGMDFAENLETTPKVIKFTPTKEGRYPIYCTKKFLFSSHREKGMEGVIEVVP